MKIKIELDDGYEEVFEVDDENDEIEDLGTTMEMMQARIKELEQLNLDKLRDVDFYHEANRACMKEINSLRDKVKGWEKRSEELEQELREAQDRIHEQDRTIAQYDDENRELKERLRKCGDKPFPVSLNEWAKRIHQIAVSHGWWETEDGKCDDGDRPFPEIVALCHSELSEALEEYRDGGPDCYYMDDDLCMPVDPMQLPEGAKPEGTATEMLDCAIRILDWMGHEGIDVDTLMEKKVKYNEGRKHRHGGKKA